MGDLLFAFPVFALLVVIPGGDLLFAFPVFAFLVVILGGDLLFAFTVACASTAYFSG
jgi:hypothetical protein